MRPVGSRARMDMKYKVLERELASVLQSGTDSKRLAKVTAMAVEEPVDSHTSQFSFCFFPVTFLSTISFLHQICLLL